MKGMGVEIIIIRVERDTELGCRPFYALISWEIMTVGNYFKYILGSNASTCTLFQLHTAHLLRTIPILVKKMVMCSQFDDNLIFHRV